MMNGSAAVTLFFVLSGFVLTLSLNRMTGTGSHIAFVFLGRRLIRLWLPILFMLAVFVTLFFATGSKIWGQGQPIHTGKSRSACAFVQRQNKRRCLRLQVEVFAAPFILLAWFASRRWGQAFLWIATFLVGGLTSSRSLTGCSGRRGSRHSGFSEVYTRF